MIQRIIEDLKMNRVRETTKKNYYVIWRLFNSFFIRLDIKPTSWEDKIVLFAGYLAEQNKKSGTIQSYISAIKAVLLSNNIDVCEDWFLLNSITKACSYRNDTVHTCLPIQKRLLITILSEVTVIFQNQPYLNRLYQALFSTAYFSLFRIGELTSGDHPVLARDIHITLNKKKLLFILQTSKTHWKNVKPQIVKINSQRNMTAFKTSSGYNDTSCKQETNVFCPYKLLKEYATIRKSFKKNDEAFFVFRDRSPVNLNQLRTTLKMALAKSGFDADLYNSHGFRTGRSIDLLNMGLSVETIKKLGRWKSYVVYRYLKG